ncbi:MAG: hypothetical protein IKK09_03075 [Clostridia bacterium]|nr:hypothetical protein [Clostridia bacterium]
MKKRKKAIKAVVAVVCILLTLWAGVFFTDFACVSKIKEPVFAQIANDGGNPFYKGPGYSIEIRYYENTQDVEEIVMYSAFGNVINAVIVCR